MFYHIFIMQSSNNESLGFALSLVCIKYIFKQSSVPECSGSSPSVRFYSRPVRAGYELNPLVDVLYCYTSIQLFSSAVKGNPRNQRARDR